MKKRVLLIMGLSIMLLAGGCAKKATNLNELNPKTTDKASSSTSSSTKIADVTGVPVREDFKFEDYITLGKYKGIDVTYTKLTVTDANVESTIKTALEGAKEFKASDKKVVANGDTVNIDFEGLLNGKAFEGGTGTDYKLTIGSGSFIPGFEDGLIGKKVGEKVSLNLTFPKDYQSTDLAGKAVVFKVTVKAIGAEVTPQLTDEYVKKNTSYKTIAEYRKSVRDTLESNNTQSMQNEQFSNAFSAIKADSKIKSIPEQLTNYYNDMIKYQYTQVAKGSGMDLNTYITSNNTTADQFNQYLAQSSENYATQDLVLFAIAKAENITVSDKEYKDQLPTYLKQYGYTKEEDMLKEIPESVLKDNILKHKVLEFIIKNANVTAVSPTPTPAVTATPAATTPAAQ